MFLLTSLLLLFPQPGGAAAATSLAMVHKLLSAHPGEMEAEALRLVCRDFKAERLLGGNVRAGVSSPDASPVISAHCLSCACP